MGKPTFSGCYLREDTLSQARQCDSTQRSESAPSSSTGACPFGTAARASGDQRTEEATVHSEESVPPALNRAAKYLQWLFNPDKRTETFEMELDSFEMIDKAEVERECPLVEWSHQEPEKDRITIQPHGWKYHIYVPSKVLNNLKDRRFKERAAFITMQIKEHFDFIIALIPPSQTRYCLEVLSKYAIPKIEQCVLRRWSSVTGLNAENGVVLTALWAAPLLYDIQTWTDEPSGPENTQNRMKPRVREQIRSNSVGDMVVVG
ncbi:hypothetical protein FRC12_020754 [Ceratobasidium sp. 428]|nr:hypothetical protein FRC12_020754 [Ceratobasidium sp. 428]